MSYWAWTRRKNFFIGFTIIKLLWPTSHRFFFSLSRRACMLPRSGRVHFSLSSIVRCACVGRLLFVLVCRFQVFYIFNVETIIKLKKKKFQRQKMFRSSVCRHEIGNVSLLLCKFPPLDCSNHDLSKNLYWSFLSAHALIKICGNFL